MIASVLTLPIAVAMDALAGDPEFRLHPVRLIGSFASRVERLLYATGTGRLRGAVGWLAVTSTSGVVACGLRHAAHLCHPLLGVVTDAALVYFTIAPRDLDRHARRVEAALRADDLAFARQRVGEIVGRDTEVLDAAGVSRAAVEAVAESTVDGVTAPLFWAALLGPVGAVVYRAANTLDSMWGHHDERYEQFGFTAARLDDVANYVPARLTVFCITGAAAVLGLRPVSAWRTAWKHGPRHASPNSGLSEAGFAGALGVTLGGRNRYDGQWHEGPRFGLDEGDACAQTIRESIRLMWGSTLLMTSLLTATASAAAVIVALLRD
ncbi:MAG: adenosylcobinamide-phosphate synthase CbiB, partial [Myxococcales bacterium]